MTPEANMENTKNLPENLGQLIDRSVDLHGLRTAVRVLRAGPAGRMEYQPITYNELRRDRDAVASGLFRSGCTKGTRIGLLMDGGLEPLLVFLAADLIGVSVVPLCNKLAPDVLAHIINHSGVGLLIVDPAGQDQLQALTPELNQPPRTVLTEGDPTLEGATSWQALIADPAPLPTVQVEPDDESKVLYTSGSSGLPKGVVQTHRNIMANVDEVWDVISEREPFHMFKSAPDYHSMGILNIYYPLAKGWVLDLARSPDRVLSDIRLSAPEGFLTVPLVLDKVFGNVRKEIDAGGVKGRMIARSVRAKQQLSRGRGGLADRIVHGTIGRKVIAKIRDQLAKRVGPNLELLIVGSAKADPEALDFFHEVLDIRAYEGYGTTECAPLIAANHLGGRKSGTVGRPLLEVKLMSSDGTQQLGSGDPASGQYCGSGGRSGELWVSGPNVMKGYLEDPEQTARVLVHDEAGVGEGKVWYRTGDLFEIDDEGFLTFRGRVGRQFKLSNGEFVNPEQLERVFSRAALVEHALVSGGQEWSSPLVLVTVDMEEAAKLAAALRGSDQVAELIRRQLLREADEAGLPAHERPQKVLVIPEPLSEETGTLTKGLKKIVPGAIEKRYAELIESAR
jgi:long-chain acyl-CoA synthetase